MVKKERSIFDEFTGKYQLSKTLRFELRPVGKTKEYLEKNKIFEKDKLIDDHYHEVKYYFDSMHREFIEETLQQVRFIGSDYEHHVKTISRLKHANKQDRKKIERELKDSEDEFRKKLVNHFDVTASEWKRKYGSSEKGDGGIVFKQSGVKILFEEAVLALLKKKFFERPADDKHAPAVTFNDPITKEQKNLFDSFKGFFTYFGNFNQTKENLYKAEAHDTAVANRAINENLRIFTENIIQFNQHKASYLECGLTQEELEMFELEFYNTCFIQSGIDHYNRILGGVSQDDQQVNGINQKINLYNQQHKRGKIEQFGRLFKQIMSKKESKERLAQITNDRDVISSLATFIDLNDQKLEEACGLIDSFFRSDGAYNLNKVYLKGTALNTISHKWFVDWAVIGNLLQGDGVKKKGKKQNHAEGVTKLPDFISIMQLKEILRSRSIPDTDDFIAPDDLFRSDFKNIYTDASDYYHAFLGIWKSEWGKCIGHYTAARGDIEELVKSKRSYSQDDQIQLASIKAYCDASLAVFQMMKYFALEKGRRKVEPQNGSDYTFYNPFNAYYQDYPIHAYYNEFRNYLTKKAHIGRLLFPAFGDERAHRHSLSKRNLDGAEKIKLNFENGMLLSGWDKNKESDYYGLMFRENSTFYIGLMTKDHHDLFKNQSMFSTAEDSEFQKMEYRQLNNVFRQLPRIAFAKKNKEKYGITEELEETREDFKKFQEQKKTQKDIRFDNNKLQQLISLYKKVLQDSFGDDFEFGEVLSTEYRSLNDFFIAVERKTYALKFVPMKKSHIESMVGEGKIFLFEVSNRDFRKKEKSADNLHTIYFRALFDSDNLRAPTVKLSGGAEIFFRPKIEKLPTKIVQGNLVPDHKRYGEDKVFLHISVVLNMGTGNGFDFNSDVNVFLASDKRSEIKIIGIDRGEKHLAYYALIDQRGNLIKCDQLDGELPNGETYRAKLEEKAGRRDEARKEWKTIEKIKELKDGYISQIVHTITDMVIKENAILVFEDLTSGFKRSRQKIEQQTYQKLELALVKKLNYVVNKKVSTGEAGHYLKAYQLTPSVNTPQDIGKQCGIVFYVSPAYTSITCPQCGYRKNTGFHFENISQAKKLIKELKLSILKKENGYAVVYTIDGKNYQLSSVGMKRLRWHRAGTEFSKYHRFGESEKIKSQVGMTKEYDITKCLNGLFEEYGGNIKDLTISGPTEFYRHLFRYLDLLLRSRNSISGTDTDYIQCAACGFHSDGGFDGCRQYNGDANGAFNIARKGLIALRKIQTAHDPAAVKWGDLKIDVEEWDKFTQRGWDKDAY